MVDPIDFEEYIWKNKTLLQNDPHRELLVYPSDDVSVSCSLMDITGTLYCQL